MIKELSDRIAIGDQTAPAELQQLAAQGYDTVIDLCTPTENIQLDTAQAKRAGLSLAQVPVTANALAPDLVHRFGQVVDTAKGRVYVRCASGRRAALLGLLYEADRHGWTYEDFLRQAQGINADFSGSPAMAQFARDYLQQRRTA